MQKAVKKIKVIEAIDPFLSLDEKGETKKLKVCAYARVSTDEEEQQNSFENQVNEYEKRINENPKWKFSGMYADKGISGTQIKRREAFMQMLNDARLGKIDLILTKSISRFGRNTVDILETVRELRTLDVTVYFEKENIYSNDTKLDFILTIMSSVAQEESRSISENIKWSVKKRFEEGKILLNTTMFLGYTKDDDGNLVIVPEEAKVIKNIYNLFLQGHSTYDISKILMKEKIKTGGGSYKWNSTSVLRILQNEKYKGDAILQKTYTVDYLTKRRVVNDNVVDKYYVTDSHEGIVSKEDFRMVQEIIKKQNEDSIDYPKNSKYPLTNLVFCTSCKRPMKRHIHNYNRKSQKVVLNCNHAPMNKSIKCSSKVIDNKLVLSALNDAVVALIPKDKLHGKLIQTLNKTLTKGDLRLNLKRLESKNVTLNEELDDYVNNNLNLLKENKDEFNKTYLKLKEQIDSNNKELSKLNLELSNSLLNQARLDLINKYIEKDPKIKDGSIIRALFKIILVSENNDVLFVLNENKLKVSEILNDFNVLNEAKVIIDKTHFNKELNQNVNYKVVSLNGSY